MSHSFFPTVSWKMKSLPVAPAGSRYRPSVWLCDPVVVNHSAYCGEEYGDGNIAANPQIPAEWLLLSGREVGGWLFFAETSPGKEQGLTIFSELFQFLINHLDRKFLSCIIKIILPQIKSNVPGFLLSRGRSELGTILHFATGYG